MTQPKAVMIAGLFTFLLATVPIFFDIYRTAVFHSVPRDDYAPYVLKMLGIQDYSPKAPYAYRILSAAAAIPFFHILPTINFSHQPEADPAYLKATEALCFVSYLSIVLTAVVVYTIARRQFSATRAASAIVGLMVFFLSNFVSVVGIDPIAILFISLLALWLNRVLVFVPLLLVCVGVNEKILILFLTILSLRWIASVKGKRPFPLYAQLFSAALAVIAYFWVTMLFKFPGYQPPYNAPALLSNSLKTLRYTLSIKGLFLNAFPFFLVLVLAALAVKSPQKSVPVSDISGCVVLFMLAFMAGLSLNAGRIAVYAFPLYLPATATVLDHLWSVQSRCNEKTTETLSHRVSSINS